MWKEIIKNRELVWELAMRDLEARYRYPVLGFLWAILQPLALMLIFLFVFSKIIRVEVKDVPFSVYLITGIFPWSFFQSSVAQATTCILDKASLIKKVYFPRIIIPFSVILSNLVNYFIFMSLLLALLPLLKIKYSFFIFFLPFVAMIHIFLTIGFSLLFSSFFPRLRDIRYLVEISLTMLFYLTPGFYPLSLVVSLPEVFFRLYMLNPFVGLATLYRIVLIKDFVQTLPAEVSLLSIVLLPLVSSVIVLLLGLFVFKKLSPTFTDYV